jgi:arsenate reductase
MADNNKGWTLYHNPRCGKSRSGLALLEKLPNLTIKEYLKDGLSKKEILDFLKKLQGPLEQILRTKEDLYRQLKIEKSPLTATSIANILHEHPSLLERPLLVGPTIAVIGRPPEKFQDYLK